MVFVIGFLFLYEKKGNYESDEKRSLQNNQQIIDKHTISGARNLASK